MKNENGIACESGKYNNFTGVIMWGKTEGVVENACFKIEVINGFKFVTFHYGVWQNGFWGGGRFVNGTWKNGVWNYGTWENGTWENGIWNYGTWADGVWKSGTWKNGYWFSGKWKDGVWHKGIWVSGINRKYETLYVSPSLWNK